MGLFSKSDKDRINIRTMSYDDVEAVTGVAQEAWSNLASRDLGREVRYPPRSEKIMEAYIWKEPEGCFVVERRGKIIGSAFTHVWNKVGWMGPLEVLPDYQNRGVGKALVDRCEDYLRERGCEVIGVETISHLPKNLHFYLSRGYKPTRTTLIVEKDLGKGGHSEPSLVERVKPERAQELLPGVSALSAKVDEMVDYSCEFLATLSIGIGSAYVTEADGELQGMALLHTYSRQNTRDYGSVKLLMVKPEHPEREELFDSLLTTCEMRAEVLGKHRLYARFSANDLGLYYRMMGRGYSLSGANVRMVRGGGYSGDAELHISSWAG